MRSALAFRLIAAAAAVTAATAGFVWGTDVAGGSDSYCYLSQAELFASGHVVNEEPIAARAPWDGASNAFTPVGHVRAYSAPGATVPMCPPGYPLIMAIARTIAGRPGMFAVVPVLGGLGVWWTFLLGRRFGGPAAGAVAAVLLAGSPPFLYQIVQPMTDVPAVALWAAALLAVTRERFVASFAGALTGGLVTGTALIVRPNLLPVAAVTGLVVFTRRGMNTRTVFTTWTGFAAGIAPFAFAVAALQNTMYGGPLKSGYGDLDFLFKLDHVWPNLQRYPGWLLQTETPIVLLALAAPFVARASGSPTSPGHRDNDAAPLEGRQCLWLLSFAAAVFACYIPYEVFDAWWYLRFLLPAYPALLVLTAASLNALTERWLPRWRVVELIVAVAVAVFMLRVAVDRGTFGLREFEERFRLAGEYVASHLPADAAIVTGQESGSVRFYSGRLTLFWRELPSDSLDRALEFLRADGYRPYLLLEQWEQPDFVQKFATASRTGELSWPPIVDINHEVRIYDPADYGRYRAGEFVRTDRVWTRKR